MVCTYRKFFTHLAIFLAGISIIAQLDTNHYFGRDLLHLNVFNCLVQFYWHSNMCICIHSITILTLFMLCVTICQGCRQLYSTTECLPRNSGGVRNSEFGHGVRTTLSSCQQNTNLFRRAGLTTPTRLGFLFRHTFYVTFWRNGIHD